MLFFGCEPSSPNDEYLTESYEHVRAAWSPDGQSVAFTARFDNVLGIYAVDTSGANLRLIHAGDALGLSWSPDGQHIAYSQYSQIFRVPVSQDIPELIVPLVPSIRPSWSPDGARIAYVRYGIRLVWLATGQDTEMYPYGTTPLWRPDGNTVMVSDAQSDYPTGGIRYSIFLVDATTTERTEVYSFVTFHLCEFFSLSPDGSYLVFSRKPPRDYAQVRRITMSSRVEVGLTTDGGDYPAVSPDGEWVAYTRTASGDGGIWIVRMDGTGRKRLTTPESATQATRTTGMSEMTLSGVR